MNGIHSIKVFNLCRGGGRSFLAVSVRAKSCTNCTAHTHQPVQREMIYNSIAKTDIIMQAMTTYKTCTDGKYFPHCFIPSALFSPDTVTSCSTRQSGAFPSPSSPASPAPGLTHWSEGCSELQHSAAEYDYSCRSIIPYLIMSHINLIYTLQVTSWTTNLKLRLHLSLHTWYSTSSWRTAVMMILLRVHAFNALVSQRFLHASIVQ